MVWMNTCCWFCPGSAISEDGEKDEKAIAIEKLINPVTQWQVVVPALSISMLMCHVSSVSHDGLMNCTSKQWNFLFFGAFKDAKVDEMHDAGYVTAKDRLQVFMMQLMLVSSKSSKVGRSLKSENISKKRWPKPSKPCIQ